MASQILRPTGPSKSKCDQPWVVQGPWGVRNYPPGTATEFYGWLHDELIASGQLDKNAVRPSRRHHTEVTGIIMGSSWIDERWCRDR